jgi:predicted metal-dependent phosphoesterase TrpH
MVDLQTHSIYSDGSYTPRQLVKEAAAIGLTAIALTDHDTVEGLPEFLESGREYHIEVVPGIELSAESDLPPGGQLHLLGLFIDYRQREFTDSLVFLRRQREIRAHRMVAKFQQLGIPLTLQEVEQESVHGTVGRLHVARLLVKKGVVSSIEEAFRTYLGKGKKAFVEKEKYGEEQAIALIKQAGGLAILAHPHLMYYTDFAEVRQKIMQLHRSGLEGFEVYCPEMPADLKDQLMALAREENFLISGGSDFHGENRSGVRLGTGRGNLNIPDEVFFTLSNYWKKMRNVREISN